MMSWIRWIAPALAVGAMAVLMNGLVKAADEPTTKPETGSVTVTVTDADGKPASGVTVTIGAARGRRGAAGAGGAAPASRPAPLATGTTDDKGVATLKDIPVGSYQASVRTASLRGMANVTIAAGETATAEIKLAAGRAGGGAGGGRRGGAGGGGAGGGGAAGGGAAAPGN